MQTTTIRPGLFIADQDELLRKIEGHRNLDHKIVLTSGVYDRWHTGHIRYLAKARDHGDILIVALDTDELVRKRKGAGRPFDPFEERKEAVASHWAVDIVTPLDVNPDPAYLLKLIKPDVFVISKTTGPEIQAHIDMFKDFADEVVNLPPQSSESTTAKERKHNLAVLSQFKEILTQALRDAEEKLAGISPSRVESEQGEEEPK